MKEIFVLVTMDVEKALPADRPASTTGPRNYEESAVFIEANCATRQVPRLSGLVHDPSRSHP